MNTLNL